MVLGLTSPNDQVSQTVKERTPDAMVPLGQVWHPGHCVCVCVVLIYLTRREREKFITRQPPKGKTDDYDG